MKKESKEQKRQKRHKRIRAKVFGTASKPRLYVFRSLNYIYAQLIDDEKGLTLAFASDKELKKESGKKKDKKNSIVEIAQSGKITSALQAGKLIAQKAKDLKIEKVVFDRGGYKYHGRVKAVAEGAREGGLKF